MSTTLLIAGGLVVFKILSLWWDLQRNIAEAKKIGLPYVVFPFSPTSIVWRLTSRAIRPQIQRLPKRLWEGWLHACTAEDFYLSRHEWFAKHGDTVTMVTPSSLDVLTSSAEVIRQVSRRREHFTKMEELYNPLKQFGNNVVAAEGLSWRVHREATAAAFNERSSAAAFHEAAHQAKGLVRQCTRSREPIRTMEEETRRLALNVIGFVGFGVRLLWPGDRMPAGMEDDGLERFRSLEAPAGHGLSFVDSLQTTMENLMLLLAIPKWLMPKLPFGWAREASGAYREFMGYLNELLDERIRQIRAGEAPAAGRLDVMGKLVETAYGQSGRGDNDNNGNGNDNDNNDAEHSGDENGGEARRGSPLSRQDVVGNTFIMLFAGHETTAATLHFTLVLLAMHPGTQRRLQRDVDRLVGGREASSWDYEKLIGPMMGSMLGACMNETLRVKPPAVGLPKRVSRGTAQSISVEGASHVLPAGCGMLLLVISAHMNPRYWPAEQQQQQQQQQQGKKIKKDEDMDKDEDGDDVVKWVPERWFRGTLRKEKGDEMMGRGEEEEDKDTRLRGFVGRDTSEQLFRPERGAYLPFADGPRACLGRRVAQVEMVAALAVIFQEYSVELAVDEWVTGTKTGASPCMTGAEVEEAVGGMGREERRGLYGRAREKAGKVIGDDVDLLVVMRLAKGSCVPVRLVKRGEEKFVDWMD